MAILAICTCAIIIIGNARPSDIMDLHSELDTMRRIEPHPNIINFLGVCSKPGEHTAVAQYMTISFL